MSERSGQPPELSDAVVAPATTDADNSETAARVEDVTGALEALLLIGIGGPIVAFLWRNTKPHAALLVAGVPALLAMAGCVWATIDLRLGDDRLGTR